MPIRQALPIRQAFRPWELTLTFRLQVRADETGIVVALHGEMDCAVCGSFEEATHRLIARQRPGVLHIDLADLRSLDPAAVSVIVRMWRLARREHCCLRVVNPTGAVRHTLESTGALAIVGTAPRS
jgi:anti-anti-sigma factor